MADQVWHPWSWGWSLIHCGKLKKCFRRHAKSSYWLRISLCSDWTIHYCNMYYISTIGQFHRSIHISNASIAISSTALCLDVTTVLKLKLATVVCTLCTGENWVAIVVLVHFCCGWTVRVLLLFTWEVESLIRLYTIVVYTCTPLLECLSSCGHNMFLHTFPRVECCFWLMAIKQKYASCGIYYLGRNTPDSWLYGSS